MFKIKLTQTKNFLSFLIGIFMALGLGNMSAFMLIVYAVAICYLFLTRGKYYFLSIISCVLTIILFIINFTFVNGCSNSFAAGKTYVFVSIVVSLLCVIIYFVVNLIMLTKKEKISHV